MSTSVEPFRQSPCHRPDVRAHGWSNVHELKQVQSALTRLVLADEGLRPAESLSQLDLGEPRFLTQCPQDLAEQAMSLRVPTPAHLA